MDNQNYSLLTGRGKLLRCCCWSSGPKYRFDPNPIIPRRLQNRSNMLQQYCQYCHSEETEPPLHPGRPKRRYSPQIGVERPPPTSTGRRSVDGADSSSTQSNPNPPRPKGQSKTSRNHAWDISSTRSREQEQTQHTNTRRALRAVGGGEVRPRVRVREAHLTPLLQRKR